MKKLVKKAAVPLLIILSSSLMAQTNVMENYNGDFEFGTFDYWRFVEVADSAAGSYAEIVDDAYSGNYAAKITWKSGASGIVDLVFDNWGSGVEVAAGNIYTVKAAVMALEKPGLILHTTLGFFNAGGSVINESTINWVLSDSYEIKELTGTAPGGAVNCWIAFRLFAENGARWPSEQGITLIDNVELWEKEAEVISSADRSQDCKIQVYPNPVRDKIHILSTETIEGIELYTIQGNLVKKIQSENTFVPMDDLASGVYILRVDLNSKSIRQTIIKQ